MVDLEAARPKDTVPSPWFSLLARTAWDDCTFGEEQDPPTINRTRADIEADLRYMKMEYTALRTPGPEPPLIQISSVVPCAPPGDTMAQCGASDQLPPVASWRDRSSASNASEISSNSPMSTRSNL